MTVRVEEGAEFPRNALLRRLIDLQYERNDVDFHRGTFRVRGDAVELFPAYEEEKVLRIEYDEDRIARILHVDPLRGTRIREVRETVIFPASHYVTPEDQLERAIRGIGEELEGRLAELHAQGKPLEAERLKQRTTYDLEMISQMGFCSGIENYSRHLDGRAPGQPPHTLLDYFPKGFVTFLDESHVTVPQLNGMYNGDRSRKQTLVDFGFRLPSALDNRPLRFEEFNEPGGAGDLRLGDARGVRAAGERRGGGGADHPPHGARRPRDRGPPRADAGGRSSRGDPEKRRRRGEGPGHDPHEADGRGPDGALRGAGRARALPPLRHRHHGAGRDPAGPSARDVRRPRRDQPAPGGARPPGGLPGGDPRRRQGRVPPLRPVARADVRPRRAQRVRKGHPLRGPGDRVDAGGDVGDGPPEGAAGGVQPGARDHPRDDPEDDRGADRAGVRGGLRDPVRRRSRPSRRGKSSRNSFGSSGRRWSGRRRNSTSNARRSCATASSPSRRRSCRTR